MRNPARFAAAFGTLAIAGAIISVAGCGRRSGGNPAPPRIAAGIDSVTLPQQSSSIVVPAGTDLTELERGLSEATPRTLWSIDEKRDTCVPGQKVDLGIAKVKVTPDLGCRIVGQVTRGAIRIGGRGERLEIVMPVSAEIAARNVGGIISQTATGSATVRATGRIDMVGNWQPTAKLDITYDWREEPGFEVAGQRITFTERADEKLREVIADLERDLPKELAKLRPRRHLEGVWRESFTAIELSKQNPPAWMRITPRALGFSGYRIVGRRLELTLAAEALTETFVGQRPADPVPTPLPPPTRVAKGQAGLRFFIPVVADYAQLEPVVERALRRLAAEGITLAGVGPVDAEFGKVTVYATTGGRLAVGVKAKVRPRGSKMGATEGEVWLSALPYNETNSQLVRARDVQLATDTDSTVVDLLVRLIDSTQVHEAVAAALHHDFASDYEKVLGKARDAIGSRQEGDFRLSTTVTKVTNGQLQVTGAGLFLPVRAEGTARIEYRPR